MHHGPQGFIKERSEKHLHFDFKLLTTHILSSTKIPLSSPPTNDYASTVKQGVRGENTLFAVNDTYGCVYPRLLVLFDFILVKNCKLTTW